MKVGFLGLAILGACSSSGGGAPDGACRAADPSCNTPSGAVDAGVAPEASASDAPPTAPGSRDGAAGADASCSLYVDDAGVTQGCGGGAMGPGDRDDGGGSAAPPPSDASLDASDLPFGASCRDNLQCASGLCFDYKVRGTFCTQLCAMGESCPPTSSGCNGMGVCRLPSAPPDGG